MVPTEGYALFWQADQWHCSVHKLLTGQDAGMLNLEWKLWQRFRAVQQRLEQQSKG